MQNVFSRQINQALKKLSPQRLGTRDMISKSIDLSSRPVVTPFAMERLLQALPCHLTMLPFMLCWSIWKGGWNLVGKLKKWLTGVQEPVVGFGAPSFFNMCTIIWIIDARASTHTFQKPADAGKGSPREDPKIANSHIISYTGIEKREGLVTIAKRLLRSWCLLQHLSPFLR